MIRVAIIADSAVHRAGLASVIGADPDLRIVATAGHGDAPLVPDALEDADVAVVVARRATSRAGLFASDESDLDEHVGGPVTMLLLERMDLGAALDAFGSGASAVLAIDAGAEALRAAVHAIAAGLVVVPAEVSSELLGAARRVAAESSPRPASAAALTTREREVLELLAQGLANKVIAARLGITEHTVKTHVAAVYDKLDARNRAEVLVAAARQGLVVL